MNWPWPRGFLFIDMKAGSPRSNASENRSWNPFLWPATISRLQEVRQCWPHLYVHRDVNSHPGKEAYFSISNRYPTSTCMTVFWCWQTPSIGSWRTGNGTVWPALTAWGNPQSHGMEDGLCWILFKRYLSFTFFVCLLVRTAEGFYNILSCMFLWTVAFKISLTVSYQKL